MLQKLDERILANGRESHSSMPSDLPPSKSPSQERPPQFAVPMLRN